MKRIAVIFEGNIDYRMGVLNAVINRVKHLQALAPYAIDVFMIQVYDQGLCRLRPHSAPASHRPQQVVMGGVPVKMWWVSRSWRDSLCHRLLGGKPHVMMSQFKSLAMQLKGYSIVSAHDRLAALAAQAASAAFGMPWFITWHGASIYTDPINDKMVRGLTIGLLHSATCNFFVSHSLADCARNLTGRFACDVLYNGVSPDFHRYETEQRKALRASMGASRCKVVAYVGRFEPVKNVQLLPAIFSAIGKKHHGDIQFWAIGDGSLHQDTKAALGQSGLDCHVWGKQAPEAMPRLMNCIDVLVLPSQREGLPLVTIEAMACGANVVASQVAGTAEAIGKENCFELNDHFVERLAARAEEMLAGKVKQEVPEQCYWEKTALKEHEIYRRYLLSPQKSLS